MFTRNAINLMAAMPQSSSTVYGTMPVKDVYGLQYFHTNQYAFPASRVEACTTNQYAEGISVGSDDRPASENDFNLGGTITSGVSLSIASRTLSYAGGTALSYLVTVTNTSGNDITVAEIGYKQKCRASLVQGSNAAADVIVLIDRTLVEPAITLQHNQTCSIMYRIAADPFETTDNGVKIVSWQFGSDEDVAAMIDAAHEGTIDLSDHWCVGDMRTCVVDALTDGAGVSHGQESIDLVITSFDDSYDCGSVMQVDFAEALSFATRMSDTATNYNGYGATEMYGATLPAIADAMPQWLADRMIEFGVPTSSGNQQSSIEVVGGNRLALRSEVEVLGTVAGSYDGEGSAIGWYLPAAKLRQKRIGRTGSNSTWWLRSPLKGNALQFDIIDANGNRGNASATDNRHIVPFMCL